MTDLSEETGQRIAKALERLADAVERSPWHQAIPSLPTGPIYNPNQCGYCHGFHGGLQCPHLMPVGNTSLQPKDA